MGRRMVDVDRIVQFYKAGFTVREIVREMEHSPDCIRAHLRERGLMPPPLPRKPSRAEQQEAVSAAVLRSTLVPEGDPLLQALYRHHGKGE